jgi:hypothetical protein
MAQAEMVASEVITFTASSGWQAAQTLLEVRRVGGLVCAVLTLQAQATGSPSMTDLFSVPASALPVTQGPRFAATFYDASANKTYPAIVDVTVGGTGRLDTYLSGGEMLSPPAAGTGDNIKVTMTYPWA